MDFSKFKTQDWLVIGGGAVVLIFTFLKWWKIDTGFGTFGTTGFDHFFTGIVPWILVVATAVLTFLSVAGIFKLPATLPAPLIFLGATALGALLILINLLTGPGVPSGVDRGIGLYLSFIGAVVATVGAVMSFQASGGNLNDLKDVNKLKGSFRGPDAGGSDMAPPPPPPPPSV